MKKRTVINGSIESNKVCHRNNHLQIGCVANFELLYGSIPDLISCSGISVTKNDILTVLQPRSWVNDTPISAFMQLITNDRVLTIDILFGASLYSSVSRGALQNHADFLLRFYGRSFNEYFARLTVCEKVIIPIFNSNVQGIHGNHWGLAVLDKRSSTVRVYDSLHSFFLFENLLPSILHLANSINSRSKLFNHEWPSRWTRSRDVFSSQQGSKYDCGIFSMLNAFHISRGNDRPTIMTGEHVSTFYRPQLALCILQNDISFLLQ